MSFEVTCYVQRGKAKSETICGAFAAGVRAAGGKAHISDSVSELGPGAAAFYGVRPSQKGLLDRAGEEGRDWYYIDNAYFDACREKYFRITRNRLQHSGAGPSSGERFAALGIQAQPWRRTGEHVLLCPQSDEFLELFCPEGKRWAEITAGKLRQFTKRELRVRPWQPDKLAWYRTLPDDLEGCHALVTFSSASAITAMLSGIPAFVTGWDCISWKIANLNLASIERPGYCGELGPWLNAVADNQFSIPEITSGHAWRLLHAPDSGL